VGVGAGVAAAAGAALRVGVVVGVGAEVGVAVGVGAVVAAAVGVGAVVGTTVGVGAVVGVAVGLAVASGGDGEGVSAYEVNGDAPKTSAIARATTTGGAATSRPLVPFNIGWIRGSPRAPREEESLWSARSSGDTEYAGRGLRKSSLACPRDRHRSGRLSGSSRTAPPASRMRDALSARLA
jgi:hypothetical protein